MKIYLLYTNKWYSLHFFVDAIVCNLILFQCLQTLKLSFDEKDREDGKKPENKSKNNDLKILPGKHLCLTY